MADKRLLFGEHCTPCCVCCKLTYLLDASSGFFCGGTDCNLVTAQVGSLRSCNLMLFVPLCHAGPPRRRRSSLLADNAAAKTRYRTKRRQEAVCTAMQLLVKLAYLVAVTQGGRVGASSLERTRLNTSRVCGYIPNRRGRSARRRLRLLGLLPSPY